MGWNPCLFLYCSRRGEHASHACLGKYIYADDDELENVIVTVTESVREIERGVVWLVMSVRLCLIVPCHGYELAITLWHLAVIIEKAVRTRV